ncbi:MAG: ankyrin repeat domain-containing protein [Bacteriovoracaceae bacterium]
MSKKFSLAKKLLFFCLVSYTFVVFAQKNKTIFDILLENNESMDLETALKKNPKSVNLEDKKWSTPLYLSVQRNQVETTNLLLKHGANVNQILSDHENQTVIFHVNSESGNKLNTDNFEILKLLIESKADIDFKDKYGRTPLFIFAEKNQLKLIDYLLEKGANINSKDNSGKTVLDAVSNQFFKADFPQSDLQNILIKKGAKKGADLK